MIRLAKHMRVTFGLMLCLAAPGCQGEHHSGSSIDLDSGVAATDAGPENDASVPRTQAVGRMTIEWTDPRSEICGPSPGAPRRLQAQIWYPADTSAAPSPLFPDALVDPVANALGTEPETIRRLPSLSHDDAPVDLGISGFPVLVMSHAAGGTLNLLYSNTAEFLASRGYVVVGISHTYNTALTVFLDGSTSGYDPVCDLEGLQPPLSETSTFADFTAHWEADFAVNAYLTRDVSSLLTALQTLNASDGRFAGRLQLDRVGMYGHSFGGSKAFRALQELPNVVAAADIDGPTFSDDESLGVNKPFLVISGEPGAYTTAEQRSGFVELFVDVFHFSVDDATAMVARQNQLVDAFENAHPAYHVHIPTARHRNFEDTALWAALGIPTDPESINAPEAKPIMDLQNAVLAAFFDQHLRGMTSPVTLPATPLVGVTLDSHL